MTSWSRLKGFARSKAICRRVSLTRLFTAEGGIPPSKEIFVERSSSSRITTLIKFVAGKTDYSSCINVFLFFKKSHDTSFIEILGRNLSARCFIASSKSRIFPCRKFSNRKCWKKQDLKYNRRRIFQSSALATLSRLKECRQIWSHVMNSSVLHAFLLYLYIIYPTDYKYTSKQFMEYPIFTKRDTLTKTARILLPTQFNPFECKLGTIVSRMVQVSFRHQVSMKDTKITKRRFDVATTLLSKYDR